MTLQEISEIAQQGQKFQQPSFQNGYFWYFNENRILYDEHGALSFFHQSIFTSKDWEFLPGEVEKDTKNG